MRPGALFESLMAESWCIPTQISYKVSEIRIVGGGEAAEYGGVPVLYVKHAVVVVFIKGGEISPAPL